MSDNEHALRSISGNKFLPNRSIVLPGSQIFNIFIEGTKVNDIDKNGKAVEKDLRSEWDDLNRNFDAALLDISEIAHDQIKTQLENWYSVLKKVMRMWENSALVKDAKSKTTKSSFFAAKELHTDADDFYVFIYDEEDRNQQT